MCSRPVLDYLNPHTKDGLRSGFLRFPPLDRIVLLASALLLPCAAFIGADDDDELRIVTLLAIGLAVVVLVRRTVLGIAATATPKPHARGKWRISAAIVLAIWMLLIQGASCPHADYLRIGPWYFHWGMPCNNLQAFNPAVLWLLIDRHHYMTWTLPAPGY